MNSHIKIKVCGLSRYDDMEQLPELGIEYGGMIFYDQSPRYAEGKINAEKVKSFNKIKKVGVFVNAEKDFILRKADKYNLDLIQLHGNESPEFCYGLKKYLPVIKAFKVKGRDDLNITEKYAGSCNYFLFDSPGKLYGGNGELFNWSALESYLGDTLFFLSGGIGLNEVQSLKSFRHPCLFAVDVNSRFEMRPGEKNIQAIKQFVWDLNSN